MNKVRKLTHSEAGKLGAIATKLFWIKEKQRLIEEYNKNPKLCLNCLGPIKYANRRNRKFCSQSCSAIFNNKKRSPKSAVRTMQRNGYSNSEIHKILNFSKKCENCEEIIFSYKKYCDSNCHTEYKWKKLKKEVELGNNNNPRTLRKYLLEKTGHICSNCKHSEWLGQPISLELEHKDGNSNNNSLENLCLICPNCHSQTPTYKNKNKGNGRAYRRQRYKEGKSY